MSIEHLIESIGLSAGELKRYLLSEIDEFLDADEEGAREEEFGDVLFSLMSMAWAHSGRHYRLDPGMFEAKVRQRLRTYATLTRHPPKYLHDRIGELEFGVLHFAFGHFSGQWSEFDSLKNGTVAEIHLLTEAPYRHRDERTNHCIVTFDDVESIEYGVIDGAPDPSAGNIVLCRIPDFLFRHAKQTLDFAEVAGYLALQVLAALDGIRFTAEGIAHLYSWECAFLLESDEFRSRFASHRTIFSPGLTVARLRELIVKAGGDGWTMTPDELAVASPYELRLAGWSGRMVLESRRDRDFYVQSVPDARVVLHSFVRHRHASLASDPRDPACLRFIAGGRPVREKGFLELCDQFARVHAWSKGRGIEVSLSILCRERRRDKGAAYLDEVERRIEALSLDGIIVLEPKVSLEALRRRIAASSAMIVPSLYDPFSLMPSYAVDADRPAFVSIEAGASDDVQSRSFTFDPRLEGDLLRAVSTWVAERPIFEYATRFACYGDLYLDDEASDDGNRE